MVTDNLREKYTALLKINTFLSTVFKQLYLNLHSLLFIMIIICPGQDIKLYPWCMTR